MSFENVSNYQNTDTSANTKAEACKPGVMSNKRASPTTNDATSVEAKRCKMELLDLAETIGLKVGERIEVLWTIMSKKEGQNNEGGERNEESKVESINGKPKEGENPANNDEEDESDEDCMSHWWPATLLEHDGRTVDSVAIRTLAYDPYPEGGFPDPSKEDVIFMGADTLVNYPGQDDDVELTFRRVQQDDEPSVSVKRDDEAIGQIINGIMAKAMANNAAQWSRLPAAQQAIIAEQMKSKKEKLMALISSHDKTVVTAADIQEMLAKTMG